MDERLSHIYAIDLNQELIGLSILKQIKLGDSAEMHGHIFDKPNRHKGIAAQVFKINGMNKIKLPP